jgi:3D (Asp-Asp-Asp) domain-containing protein
LLNTRNLHRELNPIFTDDWALPSFDIKSKRSDRVQPFVDDSRSFGKDDRLARLTAYWVGEDPYTSRHLSSTGVHLHVGHCAVDPTIIPYGSVVEIPGVGIFLAVDTGSAVVSRTAARVAGHNKAERGALVIDLFFETQAEGEEFATHTASYVTINWWAPKTDHQAKLARSVFADEDWNKIYNKQL